MVMKKTTFAGRAALLALVATVAVPALASAQHIIRLPNRAPLRQPLTVNLPQPNCPQSAPVIYVRNLAYNDYSPYATKSTSVVAGGGFFSINVNCMPWNGTVKVVLQDVNAPAQVAAGFTGVFELRNVSRNGSTLTVQAPAGAPFVGKTYYVTVFVLGAVPGKYAAVGTLTVQ
jgi:hypothetical protein